MTISDSVDVTAHYVAKLTELFDYLSKQSKIDSTVYSKIIEIMPCDLAARLRFVPDSNLGPRLAHLYAIFEAVETNAEIDGTTEYALISIEGSGRSFPFDCDLIVENLLTQELIFVDFTASNDRLVLDKKKRVLSQNIELNKYKRAKTLVYKFVPIKFVIDISPLFSSKEPGTLGLRLMDFISTTDESTRLKYISSCKEVYRKVCLELANKDNENPPGDYKETEIPSELCASAIQLVNKQSDLESLDFLKACYNADNLYFPYLKGLETIVNRANQFKSLVLVESAKIKESRDLVATLAGLTDDWLAKGLHAACLTDNIVALGEANDISILKDFPPADKKGVLTEPCLYKVAIQQKKDHVFIIKFSKSHMDDKMKRFQVGGMIKKKKAYCRDDSGKSTKTVDEFITEASSRYKSDCSYFSSLTLEKPRDTIWKKMLTISALASNDMDNFGRSTTSLFDSFIATISSTYLGACLSHQYEINKSILASLKISPSDSTYYVGVNGSFDSVTVTKMSSTLDSFSRAAYSVIFKHERVPNKIHTRLTSKQSGPVSRTDFYTTDANQLSYGLKLPYIITSLATWEIENNMDSGAIGNGVITQLMLDSTFTALINRDQFAQASEQVRYFYMSSIGYGGSAPDIMDKTTFITTRHHWEVLYLLRSYKMAACLTSISSSGRLGAIDNKSTGELDVAFPHSSYPVKSFSQTISSMYICNVYNKFRAFHEVSDAICYNEIIEENSIYKARINEDTSAVSGLTVECQDKIVKGKDAIYEYVHDKDFINKEVEFCVALSVLKSNRYSGSAAFMVGASEQHVSIPKGTIDNIYDKVNRGPIEACTMRGSMDDGESTAKHQGIRAASTVLEELIRQHNMNPANVNKSILGSTYLMDKLEKDKTSFTILSCVIDQFNSGDVIYRYRIVQKDQKGHREISVLNFHFRVGALFVETISRELATALSDVDIVNNPNKDKIIEDQITNTFKRDVRHSGTHCYDNADQKRWGPNHNMNFFSYTLLPLLKADPGLFRLCIRVFDLTFDKRAKFPETLIDMIEKKNISYSNSLVIDKFIKHASPKIDGKIYELLMPQGMCQGIFQDTSSKVHAIKTIVHANVMKEIQPNLSMKSLTTSDDAEGIIYIPNGSDKIASIKKVHATGLRVGNLMNIVRSNPKSAYNFHIAELNSIFFKRGKMATPSLKQRIAKIDIGAGINSTEDYLNSLAAASNYLSSGGSYMGSVIVSILNLVLHTEQWLRWEFARSDNYYRPVEFGGFPVIEPISTIISGGIANLYLRVSKVISPESYSRLTVNSLLCPPEEVSLEDFSRSGSDKVKKTYVAENLSVFKGTGPMGIFQLVRTDRKLSQFERRHGISSWLIPESFASLRRDSPIAANFVFSLFRSTSVNTLDTNLGVNSFYIRMAEPWVSFSRPCMRMSESSPFTKLFNLESSMISHMEFSEKLKTLTTVESVYELNAAARRCMRKSEFEIMETQLRVRLTDAESVKAFLSEQEAENFKISRVHPSIQTINLRGQSAADSDSYLLSMIKTMAGKKSENLINDFKRSLHTYSNLDVPEPSCPMSLLTAITMSDNAISLYNKFIRRDTKMIIPNKVDSLKELCLDIISNKFTENLGMIVQGDLELNPERVKPYAYSSWYQTLIDESSKLETSIANEAIAGGPFNINKKGVISHRSIVTRTDMFELGPSTLGEKTILVDSKSKDSFINTLRTWMSAKVRFILSRDTITSFIEGRLNYAHDYYMGEGLYYRFAKKKYFTIKAGNTEGMHLIQTKITTKGANRKTTYRHILIFSEDVTNRTFTITKSDGFAEEKWLNNLASSIESINRAKMNYWYKLGKDHSSVSYRKTEIEDDFFVIRCITPGTEFNLLPNANSFCLSLDSEYLRLPITYLNPENLKTFNIGYKLYHSDLVIATRCYRKIRDVTKNFDRYRIKSWKELENALDFILVGSTTDTPDWIINKTLSHFLDREITAIQLDIIRTFLIRNSKIGVGYSSSRFNQYLLNMGNRRNHNHSYLCKTIMGNRADNDSEDWDADSADEDLIVRGKSSPHEVKDFESDDGYDQPGYIIKESTLEQAQAADSVKSEQSEQEINTWADEVIESIVTTDNKNLLLTQTAQEYTAWSDSASEFERNTDTGQATEDNSEHTATIPEVTITPSGSFNEAPDALNLFNDTMNQLTMGLDFENIFDIEDLSSQAAGTEMALDTLDDIFNRSMNKAYEKVKDIKDKGLKSERTGHTVNGTLESSRAIVSFVKEWVESAGSSKDFDQEGVISKNVASITGFYLTFDEGGALDYVNPLEKFFGLDGMALPVTLSALTVIGEVYT